jgi:hypothetical protein
VTTPTGEDWFLHFQDKGVFGRVVHLQPMSLRMIGQSLVSTPIVMAKVNLS